MYGARYQDFYSQRADTTTRTVTDAKGNEHDLFLVENTNDVKRRYWGVTTQASYRIAERLDVGGNYTLSRLRGNFDGETLGAGPSVAQVNAYPEYKQREWNSPEGDLAADQRHRARLWGTYAAPMLAGSCDVRTCCSRLGLAYRMARSAHTVIAATRRGWPIPVIGRLCAPANSVDYYFTARDAFRTEATYRTDLSVNYAHRIRAGGVQPEAVLSRRGAEPLQSVPIVRLRRDDVQQRRRHRPVDHRPGRAHVAATAAADLQPFNPFTTVPGARHALGSR